MINQGNNYEFTFSLCVVSDIFASQVSDSLALIYLDESERIRHLAREDEYLMGVCINYEKTRKCQDC